MSFKLNKNALTGDVLRGRSIKSALISGLSSSGLSGVTRRLTMGLLGRMTIAEVHLTNLDTGERLSLAQTPERISVKSAARFHTYNIVDKGEVKLPRGENLIGVSWSGILPSEAQKVYSDIKSMYWHEPKTIVAVLEAWRRKGQKIKLLITQTGINLDVYIQAFSAEHAGGMGNIEYTIDLVAAKDIMVRTVQEADAQRALAETDITPKLETRPPMFVNNTFQTVANSTLWTIAEQKLGGGSNWAKLYALNRDRLKTADRLPIGIELKLPQGGERV